MFDQKYPQIGKQVTPSSESIALFTDYMRRDKGLAEGTIKRHVWCVKDFFERLGSGYSFDQLNIVLIDQTLEKYNTTGYRSRRTIQRYAAAIRAFFKYAEGRGWCQRGLAQSIKIARIYKHETLPYSPSWDDVKRLLETTLGDDPTDIRDRAIIMLLAIYGLRSGEVAKLCLNDSEWCPGE